MRGDFVIQIRPEIELDRGILPGRVEHMDSGQSVRFRTVHELLAFIQKHVQSQDAGQLHPYPKDLTKT
jgi:hypothetical protein